jgi:uncharacterized protein (TIGR03086 family)
MNAAPDPRPIYARALGQTESIIEAVRPGQLVNPTPCTDYDVRTLLSHMVGGLNRIAHVGEGGNALDVVPRVDGVPDDGWPDAFRQAGKRCQAAWVDDARLDAMVSVPWGQVPGRAALAGYVQEVVMHGWDLATATGQQTELDPELAEFALAFAHQALPPEPRGGTRIPFGRVTEPPTGAGPYAQLAAWLGRTV